MPAEGPGRVYRPTESAPWWIDFGFRGKRYRESSKSQQKSKAIALLKRRQRELEGGFGGQKEERVVFEDLAGMIETDYKVNGRRSLKRLRISLRHLGAEFAEMRAVDITKDRVTRYILHRQEDGAANATIQQELAALKRAFNLAVQAKRLSSRPHIPSVKVDNARQGFFSDADLARLVDELPEVTRPVVLFAAHTGWRKEEVLSLQWSAVDFVAGEVRLWKSKNDEPRVFPFRALPALAALLHDQREYTRRTEKSTGRIIPDVFHRKNGNPIREIKGAWAAACERAGLVGWIFHDLRRTAVRNLERAGVPRSVAMKLTGHKTEAVYRRYAIADAAALAEGVEKLAKLHGAPQEPGKVLPLSR